MRHALPLVATILTVLTGCDKARASDARVATADSVRRSDSTFLARRPHVLYQVFGERNAPRLLPVAAIDSGRLVPLELSEDGWRQFDAVYNRPGTTYTVYQDGREAGWARVTTPMWGKDRAALYSLPGCAVATPLAAAEVQAPPPVGYMVELLASDAKFTNSKERTRFDADASIATAREVATAVAEAAGIERATLAGLDFRAMAIATGTSSAPTLAVSFVDAHAGASANGGATHLFVLADQVGDAYVASYSRIVRANARSTEYRRLVDHLDIDNDGVEELLLEGWSSGRESYLLVLAYRDGRWTESYRGRSSWCIRAK